MGGAVNTKIKFPFRTVSGGVVAMFLAFGVGRFAYTPLLPLMQEQAGLGLDMAGYLASMMYLGYLTGSIIVTKTLPRFGAIRILRFGLILLALGTWSMSAGDLFLYWAVVMFGVGVSSAAIFLAALSLVLGVFLEYGAVWLIAFLYSGIGAAIVLIGFSVPKIGLAIGWQGAWTFVALTAVMGGSLCLMLLSPCRRRYEKVSSDETAWAATAAKSAAFYLITAYFLHGFAYTIGGTFMVAMLANFSGIQGHAQMGWILVGAMVIPSCVIWPLIASRAGEIKTTAFLLALLAVSNIIVVCWQTPVGVLIAAGVFGSSFLVIPGLVLGSLGRLAGSRKDEVSGFATIMFGIAMVLGPSVGGLIAKLTGSFDWSLIMACVALFLASGIALMAERATKRRRTEIVS